MRTKKISRNNGLRSILILSFVTALLFTVNGQTKDVPNAWPKFAYSQDSETVVISYQEIPSQLAGLDPIPRLRVYGDGRVLVHYPVYMKRAGDYEIYLDSAEMQGLFQVLTDIMDFDAASVKQQRNNAELQKQLQDGELFHISDDTETIIEIQLENYQATVNSFARSLKKKIAWKNLTSDVQRHPDVQPLKELAFCEQTIRGLLQRNDMTKLDNH